MVKHKPTKLEQKPILSSSPKASNSHGQLSDLFKLMLKQESTKLEQKPTKLEQKPIPSNSPKGSNFHKKFPDQELKKLQECKKEAKKEAEPRFKKTVVGLIHIKIKSLGKAKYKYYYKKKKKVKVLVKYIGRPKKKLYYGIFTTKKGKVKSFKNQQSTKKGKAKFYIGKPANINSKAKSSSGKPVTESSKNKFLKVTESSKDKFLKAKPVTESSKDKFLKGKPVTENSKNKFFKGKPITEKSKNKFFKGKPVNKKLFGVIHLLCNKRSIFCTLTDIKGRIKASVSTGIVKERGKRVRGKKRKSNYYVPKTAQLLINHLFKIPYRYFVVKIRGNAFKKKKRMLLKCFLRIRKFIYLQLFNITLKSHNGCRLPKLRRK